MKRSNNRVESGHTMLEMIAVIGMMAIITIGGIIMYRRAMNAQKADTLYNDIRTHALLNREGKGRLFSTELGEKTTYGYDISIATNSPSKGYFTVNTEQVKPEICNLLLKKKWKDISTKESSTLSAYRVYIGNQAYAPDDLPNSCPDTQVTFKVAFRSAKAQQSDELPSMCENNNDCEGCHICTGNECVAGCPDGQICYKETCVTGSCNGSLCCPTEQDLCEDGENPAGTASTCPCWIRETGCRSCNAIGECKDDNRLCPDSHQHCSNSACVCDTGYAWIHGDCVPASTTLDNACTANKPLRYGIDRNVKNCFACNEINIGISMNIDGANECEEVCQNRIQMDIHCGGEKDNAYAKKCVLKPEAWPAGYDLMSCSGQPRKCPTKTDGTGYVQLAPYNPYTGEKYADANAACFGQCDNTFKDGAYCRSCNQVALMVTKGYNTVNSNAGRCPNRIWDTNNCQNKVGSNWVKCGTSGLLSECTGNTSNIRCSYRLKTACEMKDCGEHGSCSVEDGVGVCSCTDNYWGEHCENAPLECGDCGECGVCNPRTGMCEDDDNMCTGNKTCYNKYCSNCEDGKIQSTEGNKGCATCKLTSNKIAKTTANECNRCGAEGYYFDGVNDCYGCNGSGVSGYGTTEAWCNRCKNVNSKRYYWMGTCALCDGVNGTFNADHTKCEHATYPNNKFFTVDGTYLSCSSTSTKRTSKEDCHTCDNRFWAPQAGASYAKNYCISCQNNGWTNIQGLTAAQRAEECHRCANRALDNPGNCFNCTTTDPSKIPTYQVEASECARCQAINPRIYYIASSKRCGLCTKDLVDGVCPN